MQFILKSELLSNVVFVQNLIKIQQVLKLCTHLYYFLVAGAIFMQPGCTSSPSLVSCTAHSLNIFVLIYSEINKRLTRELMSRLHFQLHLHEIHEPHAIEEIHIRSSKEVIVLNRYHTLMQYYSGISLKRTGVYCLLGL